jgi:hypothetical protein
MSSEDWSLLGLPSINVFLSRLPSGSTVLVPLHVVISDLVVIVDVDVLEDATGILQLLMTV